MPAPRLLLALLLAVAPLLARAEVALPVLFSDHMVLQRDQPVAVWGSAAAGETVTVRFADDTRSAVADSSGRWSVRLGPFAASAEGRELVVSGSNTLTLSDVLVGEVWFCSGQSNMEKPLGARSGQQPCDDHQTEIAAARHPLLRLFQVPRHNRPVAGDLSLRWLPCTPEAVERSNFSAAGYYFGRRLLEELRVPVGLIHSSVGGTRIEPWTPKDAFAGRPMLAPVAAAASAGEKYQGQGVGNLYASMVAPFVPYTVRGWLWYQGESNLMTHDAPVYAEKMRALVESWRAAWALPGAPFLHVQLAPYDYSRRKQPDPMSPEALPLFWEAQDRSLAIPGTGQAVINDSVTRFGDIHPTNKKVVGERLALVALRQTYGRADLVASGPRFAGLEKNGPALAAAFEFGEGLAARDGGALKGFSLAGEDRVFKPAEAVVRDGRVLVSSAAVPAPVALRYGWHERHGGNLVNAAGLPARSFRSDDWPVDSTRPATPEDLAPKKPAQPLKTPPPAPPASPAPSTAG